MTPDVHVHAGGQGPWIANMLAVLGAERTPVCNTEFGATSTPRPPGRS